MPTPMPKALAPLSPAELLIAEFSILVEFMEEIVANPVLILASSSKETMLLLSP